MEQRLLHWELWKVWEDCQQWLQVQRWQSLRVSTLREFCVGKSGSIDKVVVVRVFYSNIILVDPHRYLHQMNTSTSTNTTRPAQSSFLLFFSSRIVWLNDVIIVSTYVRVEVLHADTKKNDGPFGFGLFFVLLPSQSQICPTNAGHGTGYNGTMEWVN